MNGLHAEDCQCGTMSIFYCRECRLGKCTCEEGCKFMQAPVVKVHPLGELLCKQLLGIETVPKEEQVKMKQRAIKAAIKMYDKKGG